jgi:CRISPR-associated protein Csd1
MIYPSPEDFAPLGDEASNRAPEPGFALKHVAFAVVVGPSGQLAGVETLPGYGLARRSRMMIPQPRRRTRGLIANYLCDNTAYALGIRADTRAQAGFRIDRASFGCFRALHGEILDGVADTAVQAFLKFLEQWSPEAFLDVPAFRDKLDLTLAFRFQYDDEFLHERHPARLAWKRFMAAPGHG